MIFLGLPPFLLVDRPITTQLKTTPARHSLPRALPVCSGVYVACSGLVRGAQSMAACISASPLLCWRRSNFACVCDTEESEGSPA